MGSYSRQTSASETELFVTPPLDGWAESACSPSSTPGIDDLLRTDTMEASNDDGLRSVLLAKGWSTKSFPG